MGEKQINAMIINEKDHVIMTTETVKKGQTLCYRDTGGCHTLTALEDIPKYHKAAVKAVKRGEQVLKYGSISAARWRISNRGHGFIHTI